LAIGFCQAQPDLKDEWYLDLKFLPAACPLAKVRVKDKDQVVAWVYQRPHSAGGRSYGNTLGHFHEKFLLEPFRRAVVNGILWTAHCEIPNGGAPCVLPG
jgi:type 1 glutamine amidotransferase